MQFIGLMILLVGVYLIDSGIRNRAPIGFIKAIIRDPSDVSGTLDRMNGAWAEPFGPSTIQTTDQPNSQQLGDGATDSSILAQMKAKGYKNGQLPASALSVAAGQTVTTYRINSAIADNYRLLNDAYKKKFGSNIQISSGYRSLAAQYATKAAKGYLAAEPGTSNHGWGLALDLGGGINNFGTPQHKWMDENAGKYGFAQPTWARAGGRKPEPWHYEYMVIGPSAGVSN